MMWRMGLITELETSLMASRANIHAHDHKTGPGKPTGGDNRFLQFLVRGVQILDDLKGAVDLACLPVFHFAARGIEPLIVAP